MPLKALALDFHGRTGPEAELPQTPSRRSSTMADMEIWRGLQSVYIILYSFNAMVFFLTDPEPDDLPKITELSFLLITHC
jgi:hypothetical protein